ncbi:hypothetical protein ACFXOR_15990 [Streptomyces sp. NPDC059164]|uniref:hypothetical protein n=1 Tax=Streptomyces sp. NPDC059164 TaxID=3346750 RepID=UPI0036CC4A1D
MDSVTLVALVGVGGTAVAALGGVAGGVWVARIGERGERALEQERVRRSVYGACAEALLVRRDAVTRLMDVLNKPETDEGRVHERLEHVQAAQDELGAAVGAVAVEGPEEVADCAVAAADRLGAWVDEVIWWFELGRPQGQRRTIVELQGRALEKVDEFLKECRTALYPEPRRRWPHPIKRLRWQLGLRRTRKRLGFPRR